MYLVEVKTKTELAEWLARNHEDLFEEEPMAATSWIARYERGGLAALADRSHRPSACPHQITPETEAVICAVNTRGGVPDESATSSLAPAWTRCPVARASTGASSDTP